MLALTNISRIKRGNRFQSFIIPLFKLYWNFAVVEIPKDKFQIIIKDLIVITTPRYILCPNAIIKGLGRNRT